MQPSQLQPMRIGDLLDTAFRFYRAHLVQLLTITSMILVPITLLRILLFATPGISQLFDALQNIFFLPLLSAALTVASMRIYSNETFAPGQVLRAGLRRYLSVLGAAFLEGLIIGVPVALVVGCLAIAMISRTQNSPIIWALIAIILIPYVVFVAVKYAATIPAVMIEGVNASTGLRRSWALTKGKFWHTAGVLIATSLLTILLSQMPALLVIYFTSATTFGTVAPWVLALQVVLVQLGLLITLPFQALVPVVLYYDLRIRNEGYDLEQAVSGLSNPV